MLPTHMIQNFHIMFMHYMQETDRYYVYNTRSKTTFKCIEI